MSGVQVGWGKSWELLANAINDWYGGGIDGTQYKQVVQMLNSGNYTMEEMEGILQEIPDFVASYNGDGKLVGVTYKAKTAGNTAAGSVANAVNSNVATATQTQFETVQTITKDAQTGKVTMSDTVTKYSGGTAGTAKAVASSAVAAVCAASVGITVGKTIDSALYNLNPDFWDENGMSGLNPETWSSITAGDNSVGAKLFNWVFKIDDNSNPEPYIDENTFAYMVAYMASKGAFDSGDPSIVIDNPTFGNKTLVETPIYQTPTFIGAITGDPSGETMHGVTVTSGSIDFSFCTVESNHNITWYMCSKNPFTASSTLNSRSDSHTQLTVAEQTLNNQTFYTAFQKTYNSNFQYSTVLPYLQVTSSATDIFSMVSPYNVGENQFPFVAYIILYQSTISGGGGVEGITPQEGVTQFNASGIDPTNIAAILAALQTQFPDLWDNRIEISPDGDTIIKYIPVGFPTGGTGDQPTTEGATATDLAPDITGDGLNSTDELIKTLIDMVQNPQTQNGMESDTDTPTQPIDPNMPNGGGGVTPPFVIPTGSASALYSVYNPSQSQLNSLGAWLWSSNFVDQLLKLFNDPMQAIIGLHKVFATPPTSGTGTIKVGYLDSGVGSNLVSAQYTEIDCGSVSMPEYFKNALDYLKTDIYLYLPFVGIVPLNVEDVTRASINVKYKVDVLTGACLASVNVTRDAGGGGQLYVYAGNCAVQYPLSSGSYMGIVAGALGIAGSVASSVLSGGALLPMALGAGASAMGNMKTKVEHSGSLSGNSGAMGIKKPYLIIRRPQTKIADNFQLLAGESQNEYGVLSSYTGQTRVKYVHLENIPATDKELTQIEELLKSGVLI